MMKKIFGKKKEKKPFAEQSSRPEITAPIVDNGDAVGVSGSRSAGLAAGGPAARGQRPKRKPAVHRDTEVSPEFEQGDNQNMDKKEQISNSQDIAQQQGMNLLAGLQAALTSMAETQKNFAAALTANTKAIEQLATNPPKQGGLLSPDMEKTLAQLLPGVLDGIIKAFTATPIEETAAAAKGAYTDAMRDAMEKAFIDNQSISTKILQANLDQVMLNNQTMTKRLTEAF